MNKSLLTIAPPFIATLPYSIRSIPWRPYPTRADPWASIEFFARLIWQESSFKPNAVGPTTGGGQRAQ
jgi:hypothetical protein